MNIKEIVDDAPYGATHYCTLNRIYYQVDDCKVYGWYNYGGNDLFKEPASYGVKEVNEDDDFIKLSDLKEKYTPLIPSDLKDKLIKKLQLNRKRATDNLEQIASFGGETKATYHGGWSVGYYEGKVAAIEDVLDMLFEGWDE